MTTAATFRYRGVRSDGIIESGVIDAPDTKAALSALSTRGVFPLDVREQARRQRAHRISAMDLALGLRALATLLSSGLPIARALRVLEDIAPPAWSAAVPAIRHQIDGGARLGDALDASTLRLPAHVVGMIRAGEAGGDAGNAVSAAAGLLERRAADIAAVRNALAYPMLLAVAGGASVLLLVTVVLPRFVTILEDLGTTLPFLTRVVLWVGGAAGATLVPGSIAGIGLCVIINRWIATTRGRLKWDALMLRVPIIGGVRNGYATANVCATLAALLYSGVTLIAALPLAAKAAGNAAIAAGLERVMDRLRRGGAFSKSLDEESVLTPATVRLARVGEESAALGSMLEYAARIETARAYQQLQRAIRLIEPLMIILFGAVVMIVAASLLQAMYGIRPV